MFLLIQKLNIHNEKAPMPCSNITKRVKNHYANKVVFLILEGATLLIAAELIILNFQKAELQRNKYRTILFVFGSHVAIIWF